jgi:hypothetical protein
MFARLYRRHLHAHRPCCGSDNYDLWADNHMFFDPRLLVHQGHSLSEHKDRFALLHCTQSGLRSTDTLQHKYWLANKTKNKKTRPPPFAAAHLTAAGNHSATIRRACVKQGHLSTRRLKLISGGLSSGSPQGQSVSVACGHFFRGLPMLRWVSIFRIDLSSASSCRVVSWHEARSSRERSVAWRDALSSGGRSPDILAPPSRAPVRMKACPGGPSPLSHRSDEPTIEDFWFPGSPSRP